MKIFQTFNLILVLLCLIGCQKKEVFRPVSQTTSDYLKDSREYSKSREESERKFLTHWIEKQKDSLNQIFIPTSSGIWIRYIKTNSLPKIKNKDYVSYTAEIKTIANEIIYSFADIGKKEGIVGKFKEIRGIESALFLLSQGDKAEILIPSFSAYGLYGDENKIGSNVPLLVELQINKVENSNNFNSTK
ncbi:hypothetical protein [Apibacter sp. HY039]|uniref:hypothetical protein n=1 Tax=Apibacter sp. HY039 TaxID=2501476 RepID=UPI000FEB7CB4|nr:hypothetical protein [Apibacter sp. HY039]